MGACAASVSSWRNCADQGTRKTGKVRICNAILWPLAGCRVGQGDCAEPPMMLNAPLAIVESRKCQYSQSDLL